MTVNRRGAQEASRTLSQPLFRRITLIFGQVFSTIFFAMSSEFTFGDNSDEFSIFRFFLNLADHDLTEYQITQTLTLS